MPDRENVLCRIDIAVVRDTTRTARPFSYSKPCDTFRPAVGQSATTATGLGGVCLVNFLKNNACVIALSEFILAEAIAIPHAKVVAVVIVLSIFPLSSSGINRNPAQ